MTWATECGVVIPCLNEAVFIAQLVREVRAHLPLVIVVDDGSADATAAQAASEGAVVLQHSHPSGKGAALRTGVNWLVQRRFPWALLMDGDGQHAPRDIPKFMAEAEQTSAALIVGNRMSNSHAMPLLRRWANRWMSRRLSCLVRSSIPDSQCGFRMVRLPVWSALDLQSQHYELESEMLVSAVRAGQLLRFIPIEVIYAGERTKISFARDTYLWCRWWWRAWRGRRLNTASAVAPQATEIASISRQPS